ncbi:MAG: 50S ribosomal protein L31 [Candidatus Dormibacteria bacterium]
MKAIHPEYFHDAEVTCSCGNTFLTGSTQPKLHTEVCSVCHPFFTGQQRIVDTGGQVERFRRRAQRAQPPL